MTLVCGAATWPFAARAQQPRRIAVLMGALENDPETARRRSAFERALVEFGWALPRNLDIAYRFAGDPAQMRAVAAETVALAPDVIVVHSNPFVASLRQVNRGIPTVFVQVADPVESGFVDNLARPGGVMTGFANFEVEIAGKWMEILKEIAPTIERVTVLMHEPTAAHRALFRVAAAAGPVLGIAAHAAAVRDAAEIERAIAGASRPHSGLLVLPHTVTMGNRELIARRAIEERLPNIAAFDFFAKSGGLVAYGVDAADLYRRSASYVDRILRGEKPGDLPIQLPTKFELVINLTTARALSLTVPPALLARANAVIE
jgi:putative ABC transport system substrate-binding protein